MVAKLSPLFTYLQTILLIVHGVKCKKMKGERELREIRRLAANRGIELLEVVTQRPGHCEELVCNASLDGVDAVGVVGGDGTLREGVCGMITRPSQARKIPIFAFPCGTGNNFMRDTHQFKLADVFATIDRGCVHPMDVIRVDHPDGTTYSINCVTWGMARDAADTADGLRWLGPFRYDIAGFYHIIKNKLNFAKLAASIDSETPMGVQCEHEDYMMMFAQNTRCSGRGFAFTPLAKLDDGKFDLIAVKKCGIFQTIALFDAVKAGGGHVEDPSVCYVQARRAVLQARDELDLVGIDGELTVRTPISLEVEEGAFLSLV